MPLNRCRDDDKPGWKWGDSGKCFVYTAGDEASEAAARKKAMAQAAAMGEFPGAGTTEQRAQMTTARINDLPDSAFAHIEPGGEKDDQGKTVPRSKRHFPIHDAAHVRNALARAPQSPFGSKAMPKIRAAAKKFGIHVADERSQLLADMAHPVEILERSSPAVLEDVNFKDRIIEVIAVPWDEEAEIFWRGEPWKEVFERTAFDEASQQKVRIPVNRQHNRSDTVGRIIGIDPLGHQRGALASVKVARTPRGDETLQLASEGMLGASVGYFVRKMSDVLILRRSMTRRVQRAFLDHLSMVEDPAYKGAETVAVHDEWTGHPEAGKRSLMTPELDEFLADDVLSWARQRLSGE